MNIKAWPFLVSRNKSIDYQTVVAPKFICDEGIHNILSLATKGELTEPTDAYIRAIEFSRNRSYIIVYQVVNATEQDINPLGEKALITDDFGRGIYLIKGFVLEEKYDKEDIEDMIRKQDIDDLYHKQLREYYTQFWQKNSLTPPISSEAYSLEKNSSDCLKLNLLELEEYNVTINKPQFRTQIDIDDEISSIAFNPTNSEIVAIRTYNTLVQLCNFCEKNVKLTPFGRKLRLTDFDTDKSVCFSSVSSDEQFIVYTNVESWEKNIINIIEIIHNNTKQKFRQSDCGHSRFPPGRIHTIVLSPDNKIIASLSKEKAVRIWYLENKKKEFVKFSHNNVVNTITINLKSNVLVTGDAKGNILFWDLKNGERIEKNIPEKFKNFDEIRTLTFSPDNKTIAVAGRDNKTPKDKLCIWRMEKENQKVIEIFPNQERVNSIAYNPADSRILASAGKDKTIKLWDLRLEKPEDDPITITKHTKEVTSVAFSHDGKFLASGGKDGIVNIWDTANI